MVPAEQRLSSAQRVGFALLFEGALVALAVGLGWLLHTPAFAQLQLGWSGAIQGALATLPLLLAVLGASLLDCRPVKRLFRFSRERVAGFFSGASLLELALVAGVAGIGEEALFRGVIQTLLATQFYPWAGLVVASVLFGLAHFISPGYAISATLIGLYLGGLLLCFDNLLVPIITHGLYDFIVLAVLVKWRR